MNTILLHGARNMVGRLLVYLLPTIIVVTCLFNIDCAVLPCADIFYGLSTHRSPNTVMARNTPYLA